MHIGYHPDYIIENQQRLLFGHFLDLGHILLQIDKLTALLTELVSVHTVKDKEQSLPYSSSVNTTRTTAFITTTWAVEAWSFF